MHTWRACSGRGCRLRVLKTGSGTKLETRIGNDQLPALWDRVGQESPTAVPAGVIATVRRLGATIIATES
jgi:hypothetical protein